jgi:nitrogen-specific signal transduction histidine kinase
MTPALIFAGPPYPAEPNSFTKVGTSEQLLKALIEMPIRVVILANKPRWLTEQSIADHMARFPALWVINADGFDVAELRTFVNSGKVRALLAPGEDAAPVIKKSLDEIASFGQKKKPTKRSRDTLMQANERLKALTKAMIGIQRANSIGEIEMVLNEALNPAMQLSWVRIIFANQSSLHLQRDTQVAAFDFFLHEERLNGQILFGREAGEKFKVGEKEFLQEITDTTSLALERLGRLDEADTLKQQWEATFDAISHPLCIASANGHILRTNRAFARATAIPFRDLLGQNAFHAFFGDQKADLPPDVANWDFRLAKGEGINRKDYKVVGQPLGFELEGRNSRLLLFLDITEQLKIERRIFESSKLAELGTIASSIAHELNNPLGGMLSFLQLIRMDLAVDDKNLSDIVAMEEATLRCRDIIQNLLGFARLGKSQNFETMDLREAIERAVKLIELQSRSKGIALNLQIPAEPVAIHGQINTLSQAFCNILQNSIDALVDRMHVQKNFSALIEVELAKVASQFRLRISDNGAGILPEHQTQVFTPLFTTKSSESNTGLGLTVAYSIIQDHGGELEIISEPGAGTTAMITFNQTQPSTR